jgi:site-specific DNA-methyltransferase (adenine-specific)
LGWTEITVARVPDDWDKDRVTAYALADNRSAELAVWDEQVLTEQLKELELAEWDVELLGFELPVDELAEVVEDELPEVVDSKAKLGDVWQLGRHRVMCGDSTDTATMLKLMQNTKADLVLTDPPYGISYQSNMRTESKQFDVLLNDNVFLDIAPVIDKFSNGFIFVWTSWKVVTKWIEKLSLFGYPSNVIVWDKGGGYIGDLKKTFGDDYEIALVWHRGNELTNKRIGSVWSINKDSVTEYAHPTQKPVSLSAQAITHTTNAKNTVLDLFGGSGSTLIACEQTDRTCFMMELDPKYVDVIIARWEKLTGQTAELIEG